MHTMEPNAWDKMKAQYDKYGWEQNGGFPCSRGCGTRLESPADQMLHSHEHLVAAHQQKTGELTGGLTSDEQYREDKAGFGEY
jgi:hypothetical protein